MSLLELSLRWVISHDYVTAAISGCSRLEQLKENLRLMEKGPLSSDILAKCDQVWNGISGNDFSYTDQQQI